MSKVLFNLKFAGGFVYSKKDKDGNKTSVQNTCIKFLDVDVDNNTCEMLTFYVNQTIDLTKYKVLQDYKVTLDITATGKRTFVGIA